MSNKSKQIFQYDVALNAMLYVLSELGSKTDMHKLCKILYFADQRHLSVYGRSITGDTYIAMKYGPVPSNIDDILKAVRGDSFFSNCVDDLKEKLGFVNRFIVKGLIQPDCEELSESDIECLHYAVEQCRNKSFAQLTELSHGIAWNRTAQDREMSIEDILCEIGETDDYIKYINEQIELESALI